MPTIRQKTAFAKTVGNGGNVTKAMIEAKYSPATAHTPQKLTESQGWQQLCDEMGLTDELLTKSLVTDIKQKKGNRKGELELGFKVRGRLRETTNGGNIYNTVIISSEQRERIIRRAAARTTGSAQPPNRFLDSGQSQV